MCVTPSQCLYAHVTGHSSIKGEYVANGFLACVAMIFDRGVPVQCHLINCQAQY